MRWWEEAGGSDFCRWFIDLQHVLFDDVAEVFQVVEACDAEMVWHVAFDLVR